MRTITGGVFVSLDGVMQAVGMPQEDASGGFDLGGWCAPFWDATVDAANASLFARPFELLMGRKTYEIFAAFWPEPEARRLNAGVASAFNAVAKHVLTRGMEPLTWANSHRLAGVEDVRRLKASPGADLLIQGSSTLYPALLSAGLIDRLQIIVFPVVIGKGKRLFEAGSPAGA